MPTQSNTTCIGPSPRTQLRLSGYADQSTISYVTGRTNSKGEHRRMVSEYRHYWDLWSKFASANGMTLASFMGTRKRLAPQRCAGPTTLSRRRSVVKHPVEFAKCDLGINLYPLQAVAAANTESINSTYFIPGNLFARPRSEPPACRK